MDKCELERARGLENIQNFIWDFDGTLFDTYGYTIDCFCAAARAVGGEPDEAKVYELMMENIGAAFAWYNTEKGLDYEALRAEYHRIHRWDPVSQGGPFPYARELLRIICESGRKNFMFTHRNTDVYTLMGYWETLELIAARNGLDKSKTVMVGDRELDILSGARAGVLTCHVTNGKPYKNCSCDFRISSLRAIYAVLGGKCV